MLALKAAGETSPVLRPSRSCPRCVRGKWEPRCRRDALKMCCGTVPSSWQGPVKSRSPLLFLKLPRASAVAPFPRAPPPPSHPMCFLVLPFKWGKGGRREKAMRSRTGASGAPLARPSARGNAASQFNATGAAAHRPKALESGPTRRATHSDAEAGLVVLPSRGGTAVTPTTVAPRMPAGMLLFHLLPGDGKSNALTSP